MQFGRRRVCFNRWVRGASGVRRDRIYRFQIEICSLVAKKEMMVESSLLVQHQQKSIPRRDHLRRRGYKKHYPFLLTEEFAYRCVDHEATHFGDCFFS
jgi:hypothetical protein